MSCGGGKLVVGGKIGYVRFDVGIGRLPVFMFKFGGTIGPVNRPVFIFCCWVELNNVGFLGFNCGSVYVGLCFGDSK